MVRINFGISSYSRYSPGVPWEERIMEIPDKGPLPDIPRSLGKMRYLSDNEKVKKFNLRNYSSVRENKYSELPAISFKLAGGHSHHTYEMYLIWLMQRNEWIAVPRHKWSETDLSIDESEFGAYALDDHCIGVIMQAYNIPSGRLSHKEVIATEPSKLEKIASQE